MYRRNYYPITILTKTYYSGFSLLEVMIAMVIFAVGVLGLAGMQVIALENSFESASRNQAIILAYSMSDRMLANRQAQDSYKLTSNAVTSSTACATGCSSTQIVALDHYQWQKDLKQQLVAGSGEISGAFPSYTVTVRWDEDRSGATGTNCPPKNSNDLRCFQLAVELWN